MIDHRDDPGAKLGMWLFIFTELLLFGMLFVVYAVYRSMHPEAFRLAGEELDIGMGLLNTVILLISSMTVAMSITAIQKGDKKRSLQLLGVTLLIAMVFLVNKYFEWGGKFEYGFFPGSGELHDLGHGTTLFFGLYFIMTGIHALHILIGIGLFVYVMRQIQTDKIHQTDYIWLENTGLYWHLVDLIWIFLFPLLYLIHYATRAMSEEKTHIVPYRVQIIVLVALLALTAITVSVTRLEFGPLNTLVAMIIAGAKAFIVLAWYMHLKYEKKMLPFMVTGVIIIFLLVLMVTFFDYSYR